MAEAIPFGQPILVGHYSEGRDRNYRGRIDSNFRKGFELQDKAAELRSRAESIASNKAIFSDDPQAAEKLADKIARLEKRQELIREANKLSRKNDREGLEALGFGATVIEELLNPDWAGHPGFPAYVLTNLGANIRRLKERTEEIEKHAADVTSEKTINGVRIVDSVEDNRVQVYFPVERVPLDVYKELKSDGFRWTPTLGCFQAYRNNRATYYANQIAEKWMA